MPQYFLKFWCHGRQDKRDATQSVTATEPTVEPGIEPTTEPTVEANIEPATEPSEETEYENSTGAFIVTDADERRNEILNEIADKEYLSVPENFQKVLRQYEQLLWVTINMDWDSAWDELYNGKWAVKAADMRTCTFIRTA